MSPPAMPRPARSLDGDPLMIVVGGDALALGTAREICQLQGHRVAVLWTEDGEFGRAVAQAGARFVAGRPDSSDGLDRAGVAEAVTILALSRDDRLNLQTALRARDINPRIRIVLRQFNRTLANKIAQNLPDCAVLSLAWHSAATYAATAIDPSCFRGLQFPEANGPLTGFAVRRAAGEALAGVSVAEAERVLAARIVAVDGDTHFQRDNPVAPDSRLVIFGEVERLAQSSPRRTTNRATGSLIRRLRAWWRPSSRRPSSRRIARRLDPIFGRLALAAVVMFLIGTWHFHDVFGSNWLSAAFFVLTTMTTNGYGDFAPARSGSADILMTMLLMLAGITFTGIFIASGASLLTRAQWVRMQGLRRIRRRGHIVVCGAGSIGTGVIDLLREFDKPLVVVETAPDAALVERARAEGFDLLTGDGSRDATLDLCNLGAAHSLIALTNVDTLNLEIALGARARNPDLPIVLRIAEGGFAVSIARHFAVETTFSVEALAAPAFAGLSRFDGARGRIAFDGQEFAIAETGVSDDVIARLPRDAIVLATARDGVATLATDSDELQPGDRALLLVPLAPFKDGSDTLAAAAERVFGRRPDRADEASVGTALSDPLRDAAPR